jgi:predicted nuclease of restriction endonuclease-like RecB superfamily
VKSAYSDGRLYDPPFFLYNARGRYYAEEKRVRFSLQDVPKRVQKRSGILSVTLHFLRAGEMRAEIGRLIDYHEQLVGQPQRQFSVDDARACVGDYRMAHCLIATLSAWYGWRSPDWIQYAGSSALEDAGITSSIQLRLALYDFVNERYGGFLAGEARATVLEQFARSYRLDVDGLEYLLALDSEEEALLTREDSERPPAPDEVAALYNQWTFEAALFNASDAHFVIDCNAFLKAQSARRADSEIYEPLTGVGAAIKRLCFLARKLGVYYDLAYEAGSSLLHLTLYGPQELTGAPGHYGQRLTRLCRMLLGYGVRGNRSLPLAAIVKAGATVHFLQRAYRFEMEGDLLKLLPSDGGTKLIAPAGEGSTVFDSSIEQSFAEAFSALARSQGVDGWQLEREPEPLLLTYGSGESATQSIFIPDFALTRDQHRLYFEILGYWTPTYRERKIQKLRQLRARKDILLAIPIEAKGAFASLAHDFPIVEYDGQLSATELLKVLRTYIDDFAQRLATIDFASVRQRVLDARWVPERLCFEVLHCYRRSELARAIESIVGDGIAFAPGVGLYEVNWLEHLGVSFVEWLGENGRQAMSLAGALQECRLRWPALVQGDDASLEALISLWPPIQIRRRSIFEAMVMLANAPEATIDEQPAYQQPAPAKSVHERRTTYKKRSNSTPATQEDLWG